MSYKLSRLAECIIMHAKNEGLTIGEEALEALGKAVYLGSKEWATESALESETKTDDLIAPFYGMLDSFVLPQIKKIDLDGNGE